MYQTFHSLYVQSSFSRKTDRLFVPDIFLHHPLHPFVLGTHILTCPDRCDGFGECAGLLWVRDEALANGIGALALAGFGELHEVTICAPSVPRRREEDLLLDNVLASCLSTSRRRMRRAGIGVS